MTPLIKDPAARKGATLTLIALLAAFCLLSCVRITGRPAIKDASETLTMAINLAHEGVISLDTAPPYKPTMQRDPLPIWTTAAEIRVTDALFGRLPAESYFQGERARLLKLQNLLWLAVLVGSASAAAAVFGGGLLTRLAAGLLAGLPFTFLVPRGSEYAIGMDSLDTELIGALWLLLGSLLLTLAWRRASRLLLVLASVVFGLMALTKAAMFYVYPAVLAVLVAVYFLTGLVWKRAASPRSAPSALPPAVLSTVAALIPFLAICGCWMLRNQQQLGLFAIGERGGPVLLYRGMLDTMSPEEYRGAFFAWSDWTLRKPMSRLTGFTDRDSQADGPLRRLAMNFAGEAGEREVAAEANGRPDQALGWYHQSRAVYERYLREVTASGARYPSGVADHMTRDDGIALIRQHPLMHLAVMVPLIWRGAIFSFIVLLVTSLAALRARRTEPLVFATPAIMIILFYAMTSHFAERYGWLPRPAALVLLVCAVAAWFSSRRARKQSADPQQQPAPAWRSTVPREEATP